MKSLIHRLRADGCLALVFAVAAAVAYLETLSFPRTAATWPQWVLLTFGGLSLLLVVTRLLVPEKQP